MLRVIVIGAGSMGKNLVRTFNNLPGCELYGFSDRDPLVCKVVADAYPSVRVTEDAEELLKERSVGAVAVAGETVEHFHFARLALEGGKHVLVEKPMARTVEEAGELIAVARERQLTLMVGLLMLYHPAVEMLKSYVSSDELGEIFYIYTVRANLGRVRRNENALWALAPYDIAVILELIGRMPDDVCARGACYLQEGVEDVVFLNMRFGERVIANIQLSWLDPFKKRRTTIVGSRKMAVFDDMEAAEKIRIYDKGADYRVDFQSYEEFLTLRNGDILIPRVRMVEPLLVECQHFIECIAEKKKPRTGGEEGLQVVKVLCAAGKSIRNRGEPVALQA
ncbi:MAG: Gfo/Idh/MocA family oxidoreductase [Gemmatimonadota bacterium]|nr:Gfo/Idh/MocA family oxidoreductase [Gemmatimonadota bacterium]